VNFIRWAALAATLAAACAPAFADADYQLTLSGEGTDWSYYQNNCPDLGGFCPVDWTGLVDVTIDKGSDGTFDATDITSLTIGTGLYSVTYHRGDGITQAFDYDTGQFYDVGALGLPVVTVSNGRMTSISFDWYDGVYDLSLGGLGASLSTVYTHVGQHWHGDSISAGGSLTAIPEPTSTAMIALGTLALWATRRRRA
jgi:hypothetical protein